MPSSRSGEPAGLAPAAGLALYVALAAVPLALAALSGPREEPFLRELCIAIGMAALAMMLLQFLLSGRFERLSGRAGIDNTMRLHQLLALSVLGLALLHPILLVLPAALSDPGAALRQLVRLFQAPRLGSGVAALALLCFVVGAGLWRRRLPVRYEVWRIAHGLAALAAALLAAHHALAVGVYAEDPAVRISWLGLLSLAVLAFLHIYGLKPLLLARHRFTVERVAPAGARIWEVVVRPASDMPFRYRAGQFAWVSFGRFPWPGCDNPFSFASAPADGTTLRFLIKESGDFTRRIGALKPGTSAFLDAPHGNFTLDGRTGDAVVLVAGGIGIAPILSLLRDLDAARDPRKLALVYAAGREENLVCRDEIAAIARRLDLSVRYLVEEPSPGWRGGAGRPDARELRAALRGTAPGRCLAFVCGPNPMMLAVERELAALGVPAGQIVYERFVYD